MEKNAAASTQPLLIKAYGIKNATHTKVVLINKDDARAANVGVTVSGR